MDNKGISYISMGTPPNPVDSQLVHNHRMKLDRLFMAGKIPVVKGQANRIDFYHDDWCGINKGGFCDCDPDIRLNGKIVS